RAGAFTAVPGRGMVAVGLTALAAVLGGPQGVGQAWGGGFWLAEALLSVGLGGVGLVLEARRPNLPLLTRPRRPLFLAFSPPLAVGALLTGVAFRHGLGGLLPGFWLLLYGTAVLCGGALSVRIVPIMGASFMLLGGLALFAPAFGLAAMALGFAGLHIVY